MKGKQSQIDISNLRLYAAMAHGSVISQTLNEIADRLAAASHPSGGPVCPKCGSGDMELWFASSEGICMECNSCDAGIWHDLEAKDLSQFFPPSGSPPEQNRWMAVCPTCKTECYGPSALAAEFTASKHCNRDFASEPIIASPAPEPPSSAEGPRHRKGS